MDTEIRMPYAPRAQASALLGVDAITGGRPLMTASTPTLVARDYEDVSTRHTNWCLGGLNQDVDAATTVYYNPSTTQLAAPPMPDLPVGPKTQFAPQGPVLMQALVIDVPPRAACVCGRVCLGEVVAGSVGALLLTPRNMIRVRRALQAAGVVVPTAALAALTDGTLPCLCAALGSDPDIFTALFTFAAQYGNTAAVTQQNPAELVAFLNTVFVKQTLDNIYHAVASDAIANYARAEGNRAYMQPRPAPPESLVADPVVVARERSDAFCERELNDPTSTARRRAELGCLMGIAGM